MIVVSHDRYFLDRTVDRIFAFEGNGILKQYEGGYTDYYLKRTGTLREGYFDDMEPVRGNVTQEEKEKKKQAQEQYREQKSQLKTLKFSYKEQQEYDTIEQDIEQLELELTRIEEEMLKQATSYSALAELTAEKEQVNTELQEKYERWEYLSELAEKIAAQKEG